MFRNYITDLIESEIEEYKAQGRFIAAKQGMKTLKAYRKLVHERSIFL